MILSSGKAFIGLILLLIPVISSAEPFPPKKKSHLAVINSSSDCPLKIHLVADTTSCGSQFPLPHGIASPIQFSVTLKIIEGIPTSIIWSNGNNGPTLKPDIGGYYSFTATDLSGCVVTGGVTVHESGIGDAIPGISFSGVCLGDSTFFIGTPTSGIDKFQWFFGDGASSTQPSPAHLFSAPGPYTVAMRLLNRCSLDMTIVRQFKLSKPAMPTIPPAIAICDGPVTLDANTANTPGLTYQWSNGATSKVVVLSDPTIISVTNTDQNGCHATAQAFVAENRPPVNLGTDQTLCQNEVTPPLDAQNNGAIYAWKIDDINAGSSRYLSVNTATAGAFVYSVIVTDPITACFNQSQVTIQVNVSPSFELNGTNPSCGQLDGSIQLQLNTTTPAGGPYTCVLIGPNVSFQESNQTAPSLIGPAAGQRAGVFSAIVTDQTSTCSTSSSFGLSDVPPDKPTITSQGNTLSSSSINGNQWYRQAYIINGARQQNYIATESGSYSVKTDIDGCVSPMSDDFQLVVIEPDPLPVPITEIIFGNDPKWLDLFPNPAGPSLSIKWFDVNNSTSLDVTIFDALGRALVQKRLSTQAETIDVQELPAGMYIFQAKKPGVIGLKHFIKK